jgi:uncharacterized membrane protein YoaK (UPF0700 family)
MLGYRKRHYALALGLAALAGFVDSVGFLQLGGLFVSFMSGNSTRMAVGAAEEARSGLIASVLIAGFVMGVVAGALLGRLAQRWRKQAVLGFIACLLLLASALTMRCVAIRSPIFLMVFAMGAANNVFLRDGEVSIGVTYMTGTLVKFGQKLAAAIMGGAPFDWLPYLLLWIALVTGAILGALTFPLLGLHALWIAAGFATLLLAGACALGPLPMEPIP